jgi:predicted XRE-type DNA-binding protein
MAAPSRTQSHAFRTQLAKAITERLKRYPIKQEQAAELLGLPRARLSALQAGDVEHISLDKLVDTAVKLQLVVRMSVTRPYGQGEGG